MNSTQYYVNKTSGTSADTLLAVGFARLLRTILIQLHREHQGILIEDCGDSNVITTPALIDASDLENLPPFALLKPLLSAKQAEKQAKRGRSLDGFDYDQQQQKSREYREKIKQLPAQLQRPDARWSNAPELEAIAYLKPDPALGHYQTINQMKIAESFNELTIRWSELTLEQFRAHIQLLLYLFSERDNDLVQCMADYQKQVKAQKFSGKVCVSALQIVNPTTGKGANREKASELSIGNQESFWPLELLKFVGFMHAAAPFVLQGSKDRKTYVLTPQKIELSTLQSIMEEFRDVCWSSTAIKLDIMTSLRFAQAFVIHRKTLVQTEAEERYEWEGPQVVSVAHGFEATSYKDMGSAYATMNVSSINLPAWLPPITDLASADDALSMLDEHIYLIQHIRNSKGEEGSEEFELLCFYRDFLSGHDLRPFWKFTTAYSGYLISQREKNPRLHIRPLTTSGLEKLIMNNNAKLTEITSNAGFKRIAYAIRQSTVNAQYRRAQLGDRTYEVRYGLGQELMREAHYRDKFVAALCQFLLQYSAETAREEEKVASRLGRKLTAEDRRAHNLRANIAETDLDEIIGLIDRFQSSELICSMLVAYGYARDAYREKATSGEITTEEPLEAASH
jgi:hypothetical protein